MDGDRDKVGSMYGAYKAIMAAARQGTISPQGALRWARHVVGGQDVAVLASLAGPPGEIRRQWMAQAAQSDLAQRVLDILMQLLDPAGSKPQPGGQAGDEFARLFPPSAPLGPDLGHQEYPSGSLVYDAPDRQGKRPQARPVAAWSPQPPVEDLADEGLHRLLFGDTTGGAAG